MNSRGDNMDNGYHSDNEDINNGDVLENIEDQMLDDVHYDADDTLLTEPDYVEVRKQRFLRNRDIMSTFNSHIANTMMESKDVEMVPVEIAAATVIQKHVRGFLAQRKYIELLMQQFEKEEKLRREKTMEQVEEAKLLIENHQLEVQFEDYNVIRKNKAHRLVFYAIVIQRAWRKYKSAIDDAKKLNEENDEEASVNAFVTDIIQNALIMLSF